jgi:hypothetical protein
MAGSRLLRLNNNHRTPDRVPGWCQHETAHCRERADAVLPSRFLLGSRSAPNERR